MKEIIDFLLNAPAAEVIPAIVLALIFGAALAGMIRETWRG